MSSFDLNFFSFLSQLGQQFAQKCENVETDMNKGFEVIDCVNSSLNKA